MNNSGIYSQENRKANTDLKGTSPEITFFVVGVEWGLWAVKIMKKEPTKHTF